MATNRKIRKVFKSKLRLREQGSISGGFSETAKFRFSTRS